MRTQALALLSSLSLLAGCGQVTVFGHVMGEKRSQAKSESTPTVEAKPAAAATPTAPVAYAVHDVALTMSPQVAEKIVADPRFDITLVKSAVLDELRARHLLDEATSGATADIAIDHFSVEPTSNAVIFGYVLSEGQLYGDLRVSSTHTQRIEAHTRLSLPEKGASKDPLGPLYRRFAVMTADALAGVESSKPDDPVNNQQYR